MTGYIALFLLMLAGELGLLSRSGSGEAEEDTLPDPEPPSDDPPEDFGNGPGDAETITGTPGDDLFERDADSPARNITWLLGDGDDTLDAGPGDHFVNAGAGNDSLMMRAGDDRVLAGAGDDTVDGGIGFDTIYGQAGDDLLLGNGGDDVLFGGEGDDTLLGGTGADLLFGGDGNDYLSGMGLDLASSPTQAFDGADTLYGGAGDDTLHLGPRDIGSGGAGADLFRIDMTRPDVPGIVRVLDFDAAEDLLEVLYAPAPGGAAEPPALSVTSPASGTYLVLLEGREVAEITATTPVTAAMIRLVAV